MIKEKNTSRKPIQHKPEPSPKPAQQIIVPHRLLEERRHTENSLISAITSAASDPNVNVDKMERLWLIHKEAVAMRAEQEFAIAKNALAKIIPAIPKSHKISFIDKNKVLQETPYANREDIEKVIGPLYRDAGFSTEYTTEYVDGKIMTVLIVRHNSGHKEIYKAAPMPLDTSGSKNNNQAAGSTSEYGMRYCLKGAFNVMGVDVDDGGNLGKNPADKAADKFTDRVNQESAKPADTTVESGKISLADAAATLEKKLRDEPDQAKRGEIVMKNVKILGALDEDGQNQRATDIRALAELPQ